MRRATTITSRPGLPRLVAVSVVAFVLGMALRGYAGGDPPSDGDRAAKPQSTASETTPGPREYVDGIPSGFARTSDGARAAAVHFVLTGRTVIGMVPTQVPDAIRSMAARGSADSQIAEAQEQLRLLRERLAGSTTPIRYLQSILATRVDAFTPDRARVSVWSVGVLSRTGVAQPQAGWTTSTFELVWERDDWRIWDNTITPGPTPALNASALPSSAEQLDQALVGFTPWNGAS
jgi:hypothetical protein